jgi:hypothetical protein
MVNLLRVLAVAAATLILGAASPTATDTPTAVEPGRLIRVPDDVATLRAAIDAAEPGDVIQLAAGTYDGGIVVPSSKHDITIRGVDRSTVVFNGKGFNLNAIEVEADRVTLENLSAHDFDGNGFYWEKVDGFTGRYLTVWNVNLYGIYATESRNGLFEQSLVSGAADAAFYVGECQPCDTTVQGVEGRLSAIGYSGTNTGAGLRLIDSTWDRNGTGILPTSNEGQALPPPESESMISGNVVRDSGSVPVPAHTPLAGFIGIGIGVAGGDANTISNNTITGSDQYGIALFPTIQQSGSIYAASANQITDNTISGSGKADLALAPMLGPGGDPNCFSGNTVGSSLPKNLATVQACGGAVGMDGDRSVGAHRSNPVTEALQRLSVAGPRPDYRTMPVPEAQPNAPEPLPVGLRPFQADAITPPPVSATPSPAGLRPPNPDASNPLAVALVGAVAVVLAIVLVLVIGRRRRQVDGQQGARTDGVDPGSGSDEVGP